MAHPPEWTRFNKLVLFTNFHMQAPEPTQRTDCRAPETKRDYTANQTRAERNLLYPGTAQKKLKHATAKQQRTEENKGAQRLCFQDFTRDCLAFRSEFADSQRVHYQNGQQRYQCYGPHQGVAYNPLFTIPQPELVFALMVYQVHSPFRFFTASVWMGWS